MAAKSSKSPPPALAEKPSIAIEVLKLKVSALNMRADEGADDGARDLEADLLANGQILPLFVMACTEPDGEFTHEVLDGRRRLFAFNALMAMEKLPMNFAARCVVCETPEEIAQGAIVTNTERAEASHADYLLAVHRLLHQFNSVETIARILHVEPKQVRQAARLGSLDKRFLDAYKRDDINLSNLRELTRVKDPEKLEYLAVAAAAEELYGYEISEANADDDLPTTSRLAFVAGVDAYLAAGGTLEQDLFDDKPAAIQDVALLRRLWMDAVRPLAERLQNEGLQVRFYPDHTPAPEGLCELPYDWIVTADRADMKTAGDALRVAQNAFSFEGDRSQWEAAAQALISARMALEELRAQPLEVTGVSLWATEHTAFGIKLAFFVGEPALAAEQARRAAAQKVEDRATPTNTPPSPAAAPSVEVDTGGYSHDLHKTTTALCGDGLALSLAAMPAVAFDALLSQLFRDAAVDHYPEGDKALIGIAGKIRYGAGNFRTGAPLREELVDSLKDSRDDWQASGLPVFTWIAGLSGNEKGNLLATIVALNLSLVEPRTDDIRAQARSEAALIAAALKHDIREHWAPDEAFWKLHTKKQLMAFAEQIEGADVKALAKLKADALYPAFDELAAKANFVPPALTFSPPPMGEGDREAVEGEAA